MYIAHSDSLQTRLTYFIAEFCFVSFLHQIIRKQEYLISYYRSVLLIGIKMATISSKDPISKLDIGRYTLSSSTLQFLLGFKQFKNHSAKFYLT